MTRFDDRGGTDWKAPLARLIQALALQEAEGADHDVEVGDPFRRLPSPWRLAVRNVVHVYEAGFYKSHSEDKCPDGTCRRLDLDDVMRDLINVAKSEGAA